MEPMLIIEVCFEDHCSYFRLSYDKALQLAKSDLNAQECLSYLVSNGTRIQTARDACLDFCEDVSAESFREHLKNVFGFTGVTNFEL